MVKKRLCSRSFRPLMVWFESLFSKSTCKIETSLKKQLTYMLLCCTSVSRASQKRYSSRQKSFFFVTVNDADCNHIITVDLSLSDLLDCLFLFSLSLFVTFKSIATLFKLSTESKDWVLPLQQQPFCKLHAQVTRKSHRTREVWKHKYIL